MPEALPWFLGGLLLLLPFFFLSALSLDRLVRMLHDQHPEAWSAAGRPRGYFWRPPVGSGRGADAVFFKTAILWPFRLPAALKDDPGARRQQLQLRIYLLVWNIGCICLVAFLAMRYGFPWRG